ncbi:MAG: glycosyltransferase [Acidimicrobiia bacterium]|nr:glycosyltransferase [Acidimicrobiia bacterium]
MRILLLSRTHISRNPRARTLMRSLMRAHHEVVAVCGAGTGPVEPDLDVIQVPARRPAGLGRLGWMLRRIQPKWLRQRIFDEALRRTAQRIGADLVYPLGNNDLSLAMSIIGEGSAVFREPNWPSAGSHDLVNIAPGNPRFGQGAGAAESGLYTSRTSTPGSSPDQDRHRGSSLALVFHRTTTTPAQYLEQAAQRAGIDVTVHDGKLDWTTVAADTDAVVFVESPYPPIEVEGSNIHGIPVLYWVHHGEHHLAANLRLTDTYQADAVLLAHSWHLAHRFPVPVHRFPFAVAPELAAAAHPFADRSNDIALVGAGVEGGGGRYARRHHLVTQLQSRFPDTSAFAYGVAPQQMIGLYGNSRLVLNDGGDRHHPITMRIFEAIGAGAFVLTDPAPGLELLFDPHRHYEIIADDVAVQAARLVVDPETALAAAAAHDYAMTHHTYDHRIDDLMTIVATTEPFSTHSAEATAGIVGVVWGDPDVQEIAVFGEPDLAAALPTHVVWDGPTLLTSRPQRMVDAVVIGADQEPVLTQAIQRARRFVYAAAALGDQAWAHASALHPQARRTDTSDVVRIDLGADSYRLRPADHPLAGS